MLPDLAWKITTFLPQRVLEVLEDLEVFLEALQDLLDLATSLP